MPFANCIENDLYNSNTKYMVMKCHDEKDNYEIGNNSDMMKKR